MSDDAAIDVRKLLKTAIALKKVAEFYSINDFELSEAYVPYQTLMDLASKNTQVWILSLAWDETPNHTRTNGLTEAEIPVRIFTQKLIKDIHDVDTIDGLVIFEKELRTTAKQLSTGDDSLHFLRIEAARDQNGLPYNYVGLRSTATFETYFDVYYKKLIS